MERHNLTRGFLWVWAALFVQLVHADQTPETGPWTGGDVGRVGLPGDYVEKGGVFTVRGAGGGVYIAGDAFHYVYVPLHGDGELTVRAVSLRNSVANTTLGLMARETLEYDAKDVYLFLRPNRGYLAACQARTGEDIESITTVAKDTGIQLPCWLRMKRRGDLFEVFLSTDGNEWRLFGSVTNRMSPYIYVGMLACSHRTNLLTEAVFDRVSITGVIPPKERFQEEIAKTLRRLAGERPRDPRLDAFEQLARQRRAERASLVLPKKKKLISANVQTMPPPAVFVSRLSEYEKRPFDGVVFTLQGGQRPFQRRPWDESRFIDDYQALAGIKSKVFTDNFVIVHTSATVDWFDDAQWESALANTRILARAAVLGRCAGLFVDLEGYGANAWSYYDAVGREEMSFDQFHAQVKRRGEQWIRAVEAELPSPRLLFTFLMPTTRLTYDLEWPIEKIREDMPRMRYGLLPSFINGILQGASPGTILIDGDEPAYYYRGRKDYETFARYVREVLPRAFIDEPLRAKYAAHVQVGLSLYPNYYFGTHPRTLSRHMTAEERSRWYEHNLYWALATSDEYVWDWLEGPMSLWAAGADWAGSNNLPPLYLEAVNSARRKLEQNLDVGFETGSLFDAVKFRARERRPTALAVKAPAGQTPVLDGNLDDAAWERAGRLSPFMPMLAWRQEVEMRTETSACYDDDGLYIAFRCLEDRPGGMRARTVEPDDYFLLGDDHVLVIVAAEDADRIYRFCVNSRGTVHDAVARANPDDKSRQREPFVVDVKGYNSKWKAAVRVRPDSWTAELMIPWKDLQIEPREGTRIRLNLGRYRTQGLNGDRTFWSPVLEMQGDYLDRMEPELFGTLILK